MISARCGVWACRFVGSSDVKLKIDKTAAGMAHRGVRCAVDLGTARVACMCAHQGPDGSSTVIECRTPCETLLHACYARSFHHGHRQLCSERRVIAKRRRSHDKPLERPTRPRAYRDEKAGGRLSHCFHLHESDAQRICQGLEILPVVASDGDTLHHATMTNCPQILGARSTPPTRRTR